MLIYSEERYLPTHSNIITLDCHESIKGFIYVEIKAYNAGVILSHEQKFLDTDYLDKISRPDNLGKRTSIENFFDQLPNPLKPLAYLLYTTEIDYKIFSEQVGALNIILQSVYPTFWFQTPKEKRPNFSFSSLIQTEWENDREVFFRNCIKYEEIIHPKSNTEKFPIFVINASNTDTNIFSQTSSKQIDTENSAVINPDGSITVSLDDDDIPDVDLNEEKFEEDNYNNTCENNKSKEDNESKELSPAYKRLLGIGSD